MEFRREELVVDINFKMVCDWVILKVMNLSMESPLPVKVIRGKSQ